MADDKIATTPRTDFIPSLPSTSDKPKPPYRCFANSDCSHIQVCLVGQCIDPCQVPKTCAVTAECVSLQRRAICSCPTGYSGNPRIQCRKGQQLLESV